MQKHDFYVNHDFLKVQDFDGNHGMAFPAKAWMACKIQDFQEMQDFNGNALVLTSIPGNALGWTSGPGNL